MKGEGWGRNFKMIIQGTNQSSNKCYAIYRDCESWLCYLLASSAMQTAHAMLSLSFFISYMLLFMLFFTQMYQFEILIGMKSMMISV